MISRSKWRPPNNSSKLFNLLIAGHQVVFAPTTLTDSLNTFAPEPTQGSLGRACAAKINVRVAPLPRGAVAGFDRLRAICPRRYVPLADRAAVRLGESIR